jgi:hypothetical protein
MSDEQKIETEEEAEVEGHGNHPRADAAADLAEGNHPMAPEDDAEVEGHGFTPGPDKRGRDAAGRRGNSSG